MLSCGIDQCCCCDGHEVTLVSVGILLKNMVFVLISFRTAVEIL